MAEMSINDWVWAVLLEDMQVIYKWVLGDLKQTLTQEIIWAKQIM